MPPRAGPGAAKPVPAPRQVSRLTLRGPAHEASPRRPSLTPTPRWQGEGFPRLLFTDPGHAPGAAEPWGWRPSLLPLAGNRRHGDKAGRRLSAWLLVLAAHGHLAAGRGQRPARGGLGGAHAVPHCSLHSGLGPEGRAQRHLSRSYLNLQKTGSFVLKEIRRISNLK